MGKCKNATKGGSDAQKGTSPTPLSHAGEASNTGDVVCDLRDEVASLEEALLQMGSYSKCPSTLHDTADCHLNDLYHLSVNKVTQYMKIRCASCLHDRVTLRDRGGAQHLIPLWYTFPWMDQLFNC